MKKELNFELNIMPVLDILSVMICFLLLTAVWTQVQAVEVKQAVGDNNQQGAANNEPSLWAILEEKGKVQISLRDVKSTKQREISLLAKGDAIDWDQVQVTLKKIKESVPEIKLGLVMPKSQSDYGSVIKMLDQLKQVNIKETGVGPL